jgi:hypothetical protein
MYTTYYTHTHTHTHTHTLHTHTETSHRPKGRPIDVVHQR